MLFVAFGVCVFDHVRGWLSAGMLVGSAPDMKTKVRHPLSFQDNLLLLCQPLAGLVFSVGLARQLIVQYGTRRNGGC